MAGASTNGATRVERPRSSRRGPLIAAVVVTGIVVLLGVAYALAHVLATDTAPRNASVNGVHIGGLSVAAAVEELETELGPTDSAPITLTGEPDQQVVIDPAAAGLVVDYPATVRRSGAGASWDPRDLVKVLTGGGPTAPVVHVDDALLDAQVAEVAPAFMRDPVDAQIALEGGEVIRTPMLVGTRLEPADTATEVATAFRHAVNRSADQTRGPVSVPAELDRTDPPITDDDTVEVEEQLATLLLPILVSTAQAQAELTAADLGAITTISNTDGRLVVTQDVAALYESATDVVAALTIVEPRNATVQMQGGAPVVVPAADGQSIAPDAFAAGVEGVIAAPAPREVSLEVTTVPAKFTTADAEALGIKEVVGEFTTYFSNSGYHNTNLGLAAAGINNELVKPGETFSLAAATGPRNASTGYVAGGVLIGDHIEMVVGGGVSQSATTTYNAAFFAGMTDIEHHPHTQYFSQYPPGREATVYEGVLDLQFRNDTPYGVLMEAYIVPAGASQGSITVRVWSTRYFDSVTASDPVTFNYTSGRDQVSNRANCVPQSPSQGFDVTYQRHLVLNGQTTVQDYFWRYSPVDRITCAA